MPLMFSIHIFKAMSELRVIISGGGTGGHIFPAISIANAIREKEPQAKILFIGAENRMEMQRVPAAGYKIIGLPIAGFDRAHLWKNIKVLFKIWQSRRKARAIVREFRPDVAVGVGGYASGPTLQVCQQMGIPTLLQEQNSYAGVTNKLLARHARKICVAYEGMERFFPKDRIILTGNPVRQNLVRDAFSRGSSIEELGLDRTKRTVLIVGGSLGARTLNESVLRHLDTIRRNPDVQFIWQTGRYYSEEIQQRLRVEGQPPYLKVMEFITDMSRAYAAADLVVSRAGASSISEICLLGKPSILVPSPNVAEDHQTKNAMALVAKDAAICVSDDKAVETLIETAIQVVADSARLDAIAANVKTLGKPNASDDIAAEVIALAKTGKMR